MMKKRLAIMTPIFLGSGTGAAAYYWILTSALARLNYTYTIVSEKAAVPIPKFVDRYYGLWPTRTGKDKQRFRDLWIYGLQNLAYLRLIDILRQPKLDTVLIHSSFYNFPGTFVPIINWMMKHRPANQRWFVDVRDVLLPAKQMHHLLQYDGIISCSENITQRLIAGGIVRDQITQIPIPQEPLFVQPKDVSSLLSKFNLGNQSYLLYVGMVKEIKGIDLLLEAFTKFVRPRHPELIFVVAGYLKTQSAKINRLLQAPGVQYIGNQSRHDVHCLMAGAHLCINVSPNEGLPRSSLEVLALKCPALLPPNIPEFERYCPEFVVQTRDPQAVAERIIQALEQPVVPNYPIEHHYPESVVAQYDQLFQST